MENCKNYSKGKSDRSAKAFVICNVFESRHQGGYVTLSAIHVGHQAKQMVVLKQFYEKAVALKHIVRTALLIQRL